MDTRGKQNRPVLMVALLLAALALCACSNAVSGTIPANSATYTVTYDGNGATGGSPPTDSTAYTNGQNVTIPGNTGSLVKSGNGFTGWNTAADGSGTTYTQGQTFSMGSANVTFYAKWTTNPTYTVTYNGNGATGGAVPTDSTNYENGQTVTVPGNTGSLVKAGCRLIGWNTAADGSGATYTGGQSFAMGNANITLYAVWTGWTVVGSAGFINGSDGCISLTLDPSGTPYVAWTNTDDCTLCVMKYAGTSWQEVGSLEYIGGYPSLAFDSGGAPYLAFQDGSEYICNKASLLKYNGTDWELVGTQGFSGGSVGYIKLAIDSADTPYVAFSYFPDGTDGYASVMKFSGSEWSNVGAAKLSSSGAYYICMAINSSGTPYIVYQDAAVSNKATVRKNRDTGWSLLGSQGFSAGAVEYTTLVIDSSGTPYVAYQDGANDGRASVMKYDGSDWVQVGSAGFSAGISPCISLSLDSGGTPYVAYQDGGNDNKASVMKYDGSGWVQVGSLGFSAGEISNTVLAIDSCGTLYVAYEDVANENKVTVMKYAP